MWSYYGSKANIVEYYPRPVHTKIIEPFAGSARYSLEYFDREVMLIDQYEVIVNIWKWLQKCSKQDILSLPILKRGETLDSYNFDCIEAKHLMGYTISWGNAKPQTRAYKRIEDRPNWISYSLNRYAENLYKIKHWQIIHGTYADIPNQVATWFYDPPYQNGGQAYVFNNKLINYEHLAENCKSREGQVMVCEEIKANWLDFKPVIDNKSGRGDNRIEAIWTNFKTHYSNEQKTLF